MKALPLPITNIVAVRNDRFGEFLLNIPAFRALKETFPDARLSVVVNSGIRDLAARVPYIDSCIVWENTPHSWTQTWKFARSLKQGRYDMCVILNPQREFNIISRIAGIPVRVGYRRKWPWLLTHTMPDEKHLGQRHEIDYNLELVGLVGAKTQDKSLSLALSQDLPRGFPWKPDSTFLCLHPWTSDPRKQWPVTRFQELARRLRRELGIDIAVIGGIGERESAKDFFYHFGSDLLDLVGKITLVECAIVLQRARLLVSGDSGPMHLAAAVGTPTVALFRDDIPAKGPRRWGPWGQGHAVIAKPSLNAITVDAVFYKVKELMSR